MTIMINGKFVSKSSAKVSVFSEAFMYGYGVFETLRTYEKQIFTAKEHVKRLQNSAKILNLKITYSENEILKMLKKVAEKSKHKNQRIKVIAIPEGIIITSIKLSEDSEIYKGVSAITISCPRAFPQAKTLSYLSSYLPHQEAIKKGYYEAILTDKNGKIYEGAYSNIFWFEGNTLCTRKNDVLPGITAETVIKLSPFPLKYKTISLENLLKKSEIFLTQTTKGIVPITKINKTKIGDGKPGPKTQELIKLFNAKLFPFSETKNRKN